MGPRTVLVVEDDAAIRRGLADALRYGGFVAMEAADGREGLTAALGGGADLVLLDVMLPKMDGFAVLAEIRRARPALPVILVTARGAEADRVQGLTTGADDYVVKPFSAREVLARVEAVLRRSAERPRDVGRLVVAGRTVDFATREVVRGDGARATMSEREADVLRYLASAAGRVVSRDELLERVWGLDPRGVETRTVDVHVARVREKLGDPADAPTILVTVRGRGYRLECGA
ncbi:MAG: response regulator transcription factor [Planctomycetes bacterium]|nr:response regulator transcription factor [Planctomycetota bacterium]